MRIKEGIVFDDSTGEIITKRTSPVFSDWVYDDYCREFNESKEIRFIEPMTAKELDSINSINQDDYFGEEKYDGHRSLCFFTLKGNRFFSRRISKKTNWFAENTDCLPHLRDFKCPSLRGTVIDGELTMPTGIFADVQGVTGALPETAIANQEEKGLAVLNTFDILYYKGINIQAMPLWKRKLYLYKVLKDLNCENIVFSPVYVTKNTYVKVMNFIAEYQGFIPYPMIVINSFSDLVSSIWERGGEGIMLKVFDGRYEQKRSKLFLKWKECRTFDVVIIGYQPPTKEFDGKTELNKWPFWENEDGVVTFDKEVYPEYLMHYCYLPVTKPYAKGWIGAIEVGVWKEIGTSGDLELVKVAEVKGITDEDQELIKRKGKELIGSVIEIKAQGFINIETGSLRHPRFNRWREDKSGDTCIWEDYING